MLRPATIMKDRAGSAVGKWVSLGKPCSHRLHHAIPLGNPAACHFSRWHPPPRHLRTSRGFFVVIFLPVQQKAKTKSQRFTKILWVRVKIVGYTGWYWYVYPHFQWIVIIFSIKQSQLPCICACIVAGLPAMV